MRRKYAAVLVALLLAFTVSGCKSKNDNNSSVSSGGGNSGASSAPSAGSGAGSGSSSAGAGAGTAGAAAYCAQAGTGRFTKPKFALHAGLAFGTFHRYIYKPYKAGAFGAGRKGRVKTFAKAGAAALFDYHEVKLAVQNAKKDKLLCKLGAPFDALGNVFTSLRDKIKSGNVSGDDINGAEKQVQQLKGQSRSAGAPITENENASF